MTLVKICGITNVEDALASVECGANLLGFNFAESPRRTDVDTVRHIRRIVGGDVKTVGVFTDESDEVLRITEAGELTYAQLHGGQSERFAERLGAERVIRVARVKDEDSIEELAKFQCAAFYLLDTYVKGVAGGTGETFNWDLAVRAKSLGKPIFLSGGLNSENVRAAVEAVRPFGVDTASGVESSPGKKDHTKIKEFANHVRDADNAS